MFHLITYIAVWLDDLTAETGVELKLKPETGADVTDAAAGVLLKLKPDTGADAAGGAVDDELKLNPGKAAATEGAATTGVSEISCQIKHNVFVTSLC